MNTEKLDTLLAESSRVALATQALIAEYRVASLAREARLRAVTEEAVGVIDGALALTGGCDEKAPAREPISAQERAEAECEAQGHDFVGGYDEEQRCRFCGAAS